MRYEERRRRKKEEGRRKKGEGRREKGEGRRKKEEGRKREERRKKKEEGRRKREEGREKREGTYVASPRQVALENSLKLADFSTFVTIFGKLLKRIVNKSHLKVKGGDE